MSLDLFQNDQAEAVANAGRNPATALPQTFGETFLPAWNQGLLFGQSVARSTARIRGMAEYIDDIYRQTGVMLRNPELAPVGTDGLAEFNTELSKLATQYPALGRLRDQGVERAFQPLTNEEVDSLAAKVSARANLDYATMMRQERTLGGSLGIFAGAAAAGITDPINLLAFPLAAPEALGALGTTLAWGGIAAGTQTAIELGSMGFRERVRPGYQASGEPMANIAGAAVFGGALGGGIKGLSAAWSRVKTGEWPRSVRDAGNVVESEANIAGTSLFPGADGEAAHRTAIQRSLDALVTGRPANLDGVITPSILAGYEARLAPVMDARARAVTAGERGLSLEREAVRLPPTMERLSELQLDQIRQTRARIETDAIALSERLDQQVAGLAAEREALGARRSAVEAQSQEVASIRENLASAQRRLSEARPASDPTTQARLDVIESEISRPNLGTDARALLEAERASITETIAKTAPGDRRLIASLGQEVKGLEKVLARAEKAAARSAADMARTDARITAGLRKAATTRDLSTGRFSGQREAVAGEMRKAVSALADEGYGIKLPRADAQSLADRILAASDQDAEAVLRGVTDDLVARREAVRQAQGSREPAAVREGKVSDYWTDQARKRVTALAREVGYEMPRDEAAAIAARVIASKSENEALAILDELMLRPRTLADTLPGISRETPAASVPGRVSDIVDVQDEALAPSITPAAARAARSDPLTDEAVLADFDRLRADRPKFEIPVELVDASGRRSNMMRDVEEIIADADARLAAAKEIAACTTPQLEAAE